MHQSNLPKVSIIIPYVKDRGYLDKAINSVYNQSYNGEIELIESKSKNRVGYNLNRGIELATDDYVKYLCDDDLLTENSIEDSVNAIGNYDMIHGNAVAFFPDNRVQHHRPNKAIPTVNSLLIRNDIHAGTMLYRRDLFERFGMYDEQLWTAEEYEFHLRVLSKGAKIGYCNKNLYFYRRHDEQKSLGKRADQSKRRVEIERIKQLYR